MRDPRLIAQHRGGPLKREDHAMLAAWAADCAELVLPFFTRVAPDEPRPAQALVTGHAWARGEVKTGAAMKASVAAHAAARQVSACPLAAAAARAAGQAVATAHFAEHSLGGLLYALKVLHLADTPWRPVLESRLALLPSRLRKPIAAGLDLRLKPFKLV